MFNFHGKQPKVTYLGIVTGAQFESAYMALANSPTKLPIASTILPLTGSDGCTRYGDEKATEANVPLIHAWIFYEEIPAVKEQEKLKMEM